ncbi:Oidioi.mRNA.OKI2018_I69.chr1.g2665.t1.cds [Oikopleura dioica]|uniref:Oidioi.mRNA.OKI2018_I69.chr1.g2665.t1.cds n=1 Tax=Oikopleura dioica TaxID=34765 RepID=A0ABN7SW11_OIKDI|nr:Oidioi.mRNA.OKI2018_I69.chr1.g2665.t1.cds [Oikopleura dioica]
MIANYENEEQIKKERKKLIEENKVLFVPSISSLVLVENASENEKIIEIYKEKLVKLRESSQNIENVIILTQTSLLRLLEIPKKVEAVAKEQMAEKQKSSSEGLKTHRGYIKWFNQERGFGFIVQDGDCSEVYMKKTSVEQIGKMLMLKNGERVEYNVRPGHKGMEAIAISAPEKETLTEAQAKKRRKRRLKRIEKAKKETADLKKFGSFYNANKSKSKSTNELCTFPVIAKQFKECQY